MRRYFGCYYTGMTEIGTGNWVSLPDTYNNGKNHKNKLNDEVVFISQQNLFQKAKEANYYGFVWFSLDCPQGGNWIL